jgi:hypothetical protein
LYHHKKICTILKKRILFAWIGRDYDVRSLAGETSGVLPQQL